MNGSMDMIALVVGLTMLSIPVILALIATCCMWSNWRRRRWEKRVRRVIRSMDIRQRD